jgi:gliding motility-associated-like protein
MIYDFIGKDPNGYNIYKITLKIYRDCINGQADFDGLQSPAYITVLDINGELAEQGVYNIGIPVVTKIPPTINSPCVQTPNDVCVEEGVYTYTLSLPSKAGGYYVVYQRCCRNNSILNIIQPGAQGSTYYAKIPGPEDAQINSSPRFNKFPPIFLCGDINFNFDHGATDPDGDQLVYSFSEPFNGLNGCCPVLGAGVPNSTSCAAPPPSCPSAAAPPPYLPINFASPYSSSYPIASNPSVGIDPVTGKLSGKPNIQGQFVVSICVKEYRNGKLLNTHYRDFQFNIKSCIVDVIADMQDQEKKCSGSTVTFTNLSQSNTGALTYHWDFGVTSLADDTSGISNPVYTYQDTGKYIVTLIGNPGKPCSDTIRKPFYIYPPLDVKFTHPTKQCLKNNSFGFSVMGTHMNEATFNWDFTSKATPSAATVQNVSSVIFKEPGRFQVKLFGKQLSCLDSCFDTVHIVRPPRAKIRNLDDMPCVPATISFINESESEEPVSYQWTFGNGQNSSAFEPRQVFAKPGFYYAQLIVQSTGLCNDTGMALINNLVVAPLPVSGFSVNPTVTSIFDPIIQVKSQASDAIIYSYSFGDGNIAMFPSGEHAYMDPGNYIITQHVTNSYGCSDSSMKDITILPEFRFWIPNAFSPDDNNVNEVFMPIVIGVSNYEFEIFDRWGQRLFLTREPREGWNGKYQGILCKQDVYVWRISFKNVIDNETETRYGHVTLIKSM